MTVIMAMSALSVALSVSMLNLTLVMDTPDPLLSLRVCTCAGIFLTVIMDTPDPLLSLPVCAGIYLAVIMAMRALSVSLSVFVLNLTVVMDTPDPV